MMFFPPDKEEATVTIPVKVVNGKITYFYGSKMPKLKEGAIGDLILSAFAVLDENWVAPLRETRTVRLLEIKQQLLLAMRRERIPTHLRDQTLAPEHLPFGDTRNAHDYRFIPVALTEPLNLILRGTKKAVLSGGACHIPRLNLDALSLNHVYTLVSAVYEPERRSHTGNVSSVDTTSTSNQRSTGRSATCGECTRPNTKNIASCLRSNAPSRAPDNGSTKIMAGETKPTRPTVMTSHPLLHRPKPSCAWTCCDGYL